MGVPNTQSAELATSAKSWLEYWILQIGVIEYVIVENTIVLGELQKSHWLNAIILIAKKTIFNAKIDMSLPNIYCFNFQNGVKVLFNYERLKYS